jgi:site-specific DNA-cytosine methylase
MKFKISSSQDGIVVTIDEDIPCLSARHGNVPKILINEEDIHNPIRQRRGTNHSGGGTNSLTKKHSWDMIKVKQVNPELIDHIENNGISKQEFENGIIIKSNTKAGEEIFQEGDTLNYSNSNSNSKTRRGRVGKGVAQTIDTGANQAVIVPQDNKVYLQEPNHKHGDGDRIYTEDAPTIQARYGTGGDNIPYVNNIRRLTEVECERLQTFPDQWTQYGCYSVKKVSQEQFNKMTNEERINHFKSTEVKKVPKSQRYKLCGNSITTDLVKIIGAKMLSSH